MYKNNAIFSSDVKMSYYEKEQCPQQDVCAKAGQTGNKLYKIIIKWFFLKIPDKHAHSKKNTDIGDDKTLFVYRPILVSIRCPFYSK